MKISDIIQICQTLKQQGKQPSIALIKSRADKGTPMPTLISGLQQWRSDPNIELTQENLDTSSTNKPLTLEERVKTLEQEVKDLKHEITELKSFISSAPISAGTVSSKK